MSKSFTCMIFLLGILVAQVVCSDAPETVKNSEQESNQPEKAAEPSESNKNKENRNKEPEESRDDHKIEESSEKDENEDSDEVTDEETENESALPLLTCVLFENDAACNTMCSIISSMYSNPIASGTCQQNDNCQCTTPKNASLDDYWKSKFDSDLFQNIREDKDLSKKILNILKTPFKTPKQIVQDLKSALPARQLKKIRPRISPVQKLIVEDDEFDKPAIRKYIVAKLKSSGMSLPSSNGYKENLINALEIAKGDESDDVFDQIVREIRNSENKILNNILNKYLEERSIENQPVEFHDEETLIEIMDSALVNQIIKPTRGKKRTKGTFTLQPSSSLNRKRPSNSANSSNKQKTPNEAWLLRGSDKRQTPALRVESVRSATPAASAIKNNPLYILEDIDKEEVAKLKNGNSEYDKCWKKPNSYEVCLTKMTGVKYFTWINEKIPLKLQTKEYGGDYLQSWTFEDGNVDINRNSRGKKITQRWELPNAEWRYTKSINGEVSEEWEGQKDEDALQRYKSAIDSWCAVNYFYMGKENCAIY